MVEYYCILFLLWHLERSLYPLLLPSGNVNLDTMDRLLSKGGVPTDMVEVYTTVPHPRLEDNLRSVLEQSIPHYIVYFSPSGVHTSYPILKESVDIGNTKVQSLTSFHHSIIFNIVDTSEMLRVLFYNLFWRNLTFST